MKLKYVIFSIFLLFFSNIYSQLSKKHIIPPLTSSDGFTNQYIYISTPNPNNVSYKIIPVGNPDIAGYSGIVSNGFPVSQSILELDGSIDDNATNNDDSQLHIKSSTIGTVFTNKGFIIEANDAIYVSIRVRSSFGSNGQRNHAGALVSKGASALGIQFRIGGFVKEGSVPNAHLTFASIMATEDGTNVTFDDLPAGITLIGSGTVPSNIPLNKYESYIIAASGDNTKLLIGGLILSDKPIVVNSGSANGSFSDNNNRSDYGFDQIVGASKIGSEYIIVRGIGGDSYENALVIAHEDNTEVFVNDVSNITLNAGEKRVIEGDLFSTDGNMYIKSTKPVFLYQGIGGSGDKANQGLFFVPPLSCENIGDVDNIAQIDKIGSATFQGGISIVTNVGAKITINNQLISNLAGVQGPFTVPGNSNYETWKVTGLTDDIKVQSDKELYCAFFNSNGNAATGGYYSGFPTAPEINFNTSVDTSGNCIPNVTLIATNTAVFESYVWQYFNVASANWEDKAIDVDYMPIVTEPGKYRLVGTVKCTGRVFESLEVIVSICPDDADNDLIIDNLDPDIDNDGILNCDESIGNGTLDISVPNTPK
ncbi:MAG: IgGFc-binding protein, partial [Polaribacter sp.]